jgi:hypothetical protein
MSKSKLKPPTPHSHTRRQVLEEPAHLLKQHEGHLLEVRQLFSAAVEDFFSHLVNQKRLQKAQAAESNAIDKLNESEPTCRSSRGVRARSGRKQEHARVVQLHADIVTSSPSSIPVLTVVWTGTS